MVIERIRHASCHGCKRCQKDRIIMERDDRFKIGDELILSVTQKQFWLLISILFLIPALMIMLISFLLWSLELKEIVLGGIIIFMIILYFLGMVLVRDKISKFFKIEALPTESF